MHSIHSMYVGSLCDSWESIMLDAVYLAVLWLLPHCGYCAHVAAVLLTGCILLTFGRSMHVGSLCDWLESILHDALLLAEF